MSPEPRPRARSPSPRPGGFPRSSELPRDPGAQGSVLTAAPGQPATSPAASDHIAHGCKQKKPPRREEKAVPALASPLVPIYQESPPLLQPWGGTVPAPFPFPFLPGGRSCLVAVRHSSSSAPGPARARVSTAPFILTKSEADDLDIVRVTHREWAREELDPLLRTADPILFTHRGRTTAHGPNLGPYLSP